MKYDLLGAILALALGCGEKPDASAAQPESADALRSTFKQEAEKAITEANADQAADDLLKEIAGDAQ